MTRLIKGVAVFGLFATVTLSAKPVSFVGTFDVVPSVESARSDRADCANFDGTWKGYCTSPDGTVKEETFTVKQKECAAVEVSAGEKMKMPVLIGGSFGVTGAIPGAPATTFGGSLTSNWNKDKKVLSVYAMGGGKKLVAEEGTEGFFVKSDMMLINEKKMAVDMFAAGSKGSKIGFCQFDKQ